MLRDTTSAPPSKWIEALCSNIGLLTGTLPSVHSLQSINADGKVCIYLGDLDTATLRNPDSADFEGIKMMCTRAKSVLWLTRGGTFHCENVDAALSIGFLRSVREEFAGKRLVSLDLNPSRGLWSIEDILHLTTILEKSLIAPRGDGYEDYEFSERNGVIHVLRYFLDAERIQAVVRQASEESTPEKEPFFKPGRPLKMHIETPGLLNTLIFKHDADAYTDIPVGYLEVEPKAFGVNFRDIMVAMGQLPSETTLGFECSGLITRVGLEAAAQGFKPGDKVAALLKGNYANLVRMPWTNVVKIPDNLSFEDAASIPMAFTTAYVSIFDTGRLQRGERILIHAASGGVGQAAILLAKHVGAEIFATVSTKEKRDFLVEKYEILPDHIFSSRDSSFSKGILSKTQGKGVDVVINSLAGTLLQAGLDCLAQFGRFVEIGKRDLAINSNLGMNVFNRSASFTHVDLLQLEEHRGSQIQRAMVEIMRLLSEGHITLLPITVLPLGELESAFRLMQAGRHMGKIIISVKPVDLVPVSLMISTASVRRVNILLGVTPSAICHIPP